MYTRLARSEGSGETLQKGRQRLALAVCRCDKYQNLAHNLQQGPYRQACVKFKEFSRFFGCFVALRPKSTAMVIAGRSVHLTTLFPGQA